MEDEPNYISPIYLFADLLIEFKYIPLVKGEKKGGGKLKPTQYFHNFPSFWNIVIIASNNMSIKNSL